MKAREATETNNIEKGGGIHLVRRSNGLLWPTNRKGKAWSASRLTKFIRDLEYKDIPDYILQLAIKRGKTFHEVIQMYFQEGSCAVVCEISKKEKNKLTPVEKRIQETINFIEENENLKLAKFLGSEQLHYTFYKGELIATYSDINFENHILELKTNSIKMRENPVFLLTFSIQLLIQQLCTRKDVYLLWSTGEGIIFNKFRATEELFQVLDILIEVAQDEEEYSEKAKKMIADKLLTFYSHKSLFN